MESALFFCYEIHFIDIQLVIKKFEKKYADLLFRESAYFCGNF